jgi:hypothetical protein
MLNVKDRDNTAPRAAVSQLAGPEEVVMSLRSALRLVATVIVCLSICPPLEATCPDREVSSPSVGRAGVNGQETEVPTEESLEERAEKGDADAQVQLADKYFNDARWGSGAWKISGYFKAVPWYRRAAEQGHPGGQFGLGFMYSIGRGGLERDLVEAFMWMYLAAKAPGKNQKLYLNALGKVAKEMTQEQIDEAVRRGQERKPKPPQESQEPTLE